MDRGYEGDSGYLGHLGSAAGTDRWDAGPADRGDTRGRDDAAAGVARRLQARLDRQLWLLERLQSEQLHPEPPGLPELQDTARRMRRDTESLLLLSGSEPGARSGGPRPLGDLVADAAAAAEEPRRVDVRPAPSVLVAPAAAAEFVHVLAELVDHVTAVYPGARVELVSHLESRADGPGTGGKGATVDAIVDGAARHDPDGLGGRRAAAAAEQLARCSRHGIALRRPVGGPPPTGSGLVASVHCPPAAVTVQEPPPPPPPPPRARVATGWRRTTWATSSWAPSSWAVSPTVGPRAAVSTTAVSTAAGPRMAGSTTAGSRTAGSTTAGSRTGGSRTAGSTNGNGNGIGNGRAAGGTNGSSPPPEPSNGAVRPSLSFDETPAYSPSSSSQVDELFGPLLDLPLEPIDDRYATPIFEAIASAWFREDGSGAGTGRPVRVAGLGDPAGRRVARGRRPRRPPRTRTPHRPPPACPAAARAASSCRRRAAPTRTGRTAPRPAVAPPSASPTASATGSAPTSAACARAGTARWGPKGRRSPSDW